MTASQAASQSGRLGYTSRAMSPATTRLDQTLLSRLGACPSPQPCTKLVSHKETNSSLPVRSQLRSSCWRFRYIHTHVLYRCIYLHVYTHMARNAQEREEKEKEKSRFYFAWSVTEKRAWETLETSARRRTLLEPIPNKVCLKPVIYLLAYESRQVMGSICKKNPGPTKSHSRAVAAAATSTSNFKPFLIEGITNKPGALEDKQSIDPLTDRVKRSTTNPASYTYPSTKSENKRREKTKARVFPVAHRMLPIYIPSSLRFRKFHSRTSQKGAAAAHKQSPLPKERKKENIAKKQKNSKLYPTNPLPKKVISTHTHVRSKKNKKYSTVLYLAR